MESQTQNVIMLLVGALQAGLLWWMKETWSTQKALAAELRDMRLLSDTRMAVLNTTITDFRIRVAQDYASKADIREIKDMLQELTRDMHDKADKP